VFLAWVSLIRILSMQGVPNSEGMDDASIGREENTRKKAKLDPVEQTQTTQTENNELKIVVQVGEYRPNIAHRAVLAINNLLQGAGLTFLVDTKTLLSLSLTSKEFNVRFYISDTVMFYYRKYKPLELYRPRRLTIKSCNWNGLIMLENNLYNVRELSFSDTFNNPVLVSLGNYFRVQNITHLTFGKAYNLTLNLHFFPRLTHLTLGHDYKQPLDNLPQTLTYLKLDYFFDKSVDRLPANLTHLTLGNCFQQPVNHLPQTLTHLEFAFSFNQPLDNLPASLTHLTLSHYFTQTLDRLPPRLVYLKCGYNFNHPVKKFPSSLRHIIFGELFNRDVSSITKQVTDLVFGYRFDFPLVDFPCLKRLTLRKGYKHSLATLPRDIVIRFTQGPNDPI